MQKWEYCVITGVKIIASSYEGSFPMIHYFSINGITKTVDLGKSEAKNRPAGFEKVSEGGYIAHAIAALGLEGWEMVSTVLADEPMGATAVHCIYFRRPVE